MTSITVATYPISDNQLIDPAAELYMDKFKAVVAAGRDLRKALGIADSMLAPLCIYGDDKFIAEAKVLLRSFLKCDRIDTPSTHALWESAINGYSAPVTVGDVSICFLVLPDTTKEVKRISAVIAKLQSELTSLDARQSNSDFVNKAPAHVVADIITRRDKCIVELASNKAMLARISNN